MHNPKVVKRTHANNVEVRRIRVNVAESKEKALLCWVTKKSPYNVPTNKPRTTDNMGLLCSC